MSKKQLISMTVVLCALLAGFSQAKAQVACGDTITTSEVLTEDLLCTFHDPALTIQGPEGSLDMRGFTLSCGGFRATGIRLEGSRARLQNGTVRDCNDGVVVVGSGNHVVQEMIVGPNEDIGLWIISSGNRLTGTTARENRLGFEDDGENNLFSGNRATNNELEGFFFGDNSGGTYTGNIATDNDDDGFRVEGRNHTLSLNIARNNELDGFRVVGTINSTLTLNVARNNLDDGIDVEFNSTNNRLTLNVASGNGSRNFEGNGGFDLEDDTPNCDENRWRFNLGTRNQNCIR